MEDEEAKEAKRRKILEETRDIDADSASESESDSEDESEDETAELQRELEKIKRERAEKREAEEREKAAEEEAERERDVAGGNPLLAPKQDFGVKRRWDDDVIFRNQARGTEGKDKKEFVNVSSDGWDGEVGWDDANVWIGLAEIGFPQEVYEQVCEVRVIWGLEGGLGMGMKCRVWDTNAGMRVMV